MQYLIIKTKQCRGMDREAAARIMSSEYKKNDGKATDWSKRAQSAADRNEAASELNAVRHTQLVSIECCTMLYQEHVNWWNMCSWLYIIIQNILL